MKKIQTTKKFSSEMVVRIFLKIRTQSETSYNIWSTKMKLTFNLSRVIQLETTYIYGTTRAYEE